MSKLRIVFMGTPDFAVTILDKVLQENYNVVGVITAPDKQAGRGRKIQQSAVKQYAVEKGLTVLQPTNLKAPEFQAELEALKPNLQIVVAFRMLPQSVWSLPEYGTFNLHASLLPDYRGAAPINWAIINGETETGTSTFFLDDKIDTGEIILQNKTNIAPNETVGELHDKLMHLGSDLVVETLELIEKGDVKTQKQAAHSDKLAYKIHTDTCKINWNQTSDKIHNHIRGLNPYPAAWTTLKNDDQEISVKIYGCEIIEEPHQLQPGSIVTDKKNIKVATLNGYIKINQLKLAGKKLMDAASLLNGYTFSDNANML
ncbi:methionyl-tRNA formyltransferase [Wenyingzhuangia fucanilytica]|uniref:Methionyl-tRNA formyltransferase n=1 Tax=Wenyingzhuangia fucanilytica TaxID=1790137 RepID=A0A1B1Y7R9_9FLAO|nr:methionyl-tRNA formyltransferase [Wenyingzhuangia fucanilytica]ANW96797.1 methionyl-tRNA formyltransferase [Wenyingzhuangia fucanilytica]